MGFSVTSLSLFVIFGTSFVVVLIGTASPDWAHYNFDESANMTDSMSSSSSYSYEDYSYSYSDDGANVITGALPSGDGMISPFGVMDNNNDKYYWLKPNCKIYNDDGDVTYIIPSNGECDEIRTIQVMSLFATFTSFFAFIGSIIIIAQGEKGRKLALFSSLFAGACGIIAMSIFVDQKFHNRGSFFEYGGDEFHYGYSLGLFTGGWILNIVGAFITLNAKLDNEKPQRPHLAPSHSLLIFLFFIALTCIIIGTGSPEWAYNFNEGESSGALYDFPHGEIDVGPFGFYVTESDKFYWLRPNCRYYDEDGKGQMDVATRSLCDEFRTEQVFAIMAVVTSFFGFIGSLNVAFKQGGPGPVVLSGFATCVFGIISMGVFIDQRREDRGYFENGGEHWDYGYSIGLFTGGWIAGLLGGLLAMVAGRGSESGHKHPSQAQPNTAAPGIQAGSA